MLEAWEGRQNSGGPLLAPLIGQGLPGRNGLPTRELSAPLSCPQLVPVLSWLRRASPTTKSFLRGTAAGAAGDAQRSTACWASSRCQLPPAPPPPPSLPSSVCLASATDCRAMMSGRSGKPAVARSRSILRFGAEAVSARGGPSSGTDSPLAARPRPPSSMFEDDSVCDGDREMNLAPDCCCCCCGRS